MYFYVLNLNVISGRGSRWIEMLIWYGLYGKKFFHCFFRNCQILTMMLQKFNFPTISLHSMMKQVRLIVTVTFIR